MVFVLALFGSALGFTKFDTCPGARARAHTMAQMNVGFTNTCAEVSAEILSRGNGEAGWMDPHNHGTYTVLSSDPAMLKLKRRTGNNKYTDVMTFKLADANGGCAATVCSESQGNSNNDAGTNMCNMFDLFCNGDEKNDRTGIACHTINTALGYTVSNLECGRFTGGGNYKGHQCQNAQQTCLRVSTNVRDLLENEEDMDLLADEEEVADIFSNPTMLRILNSIHSMREE